MAYLLAHNRLSVGFAIRTCRRPTARCRLAGMRLFTGLDIPPQTKAELSGVIQRLRPSARVRWSRVENLHITTKFIGEWPEARLAELKEALQGVGGGPIHIKIRGLGWFPNPHAPRIFWVAVDGGDALRELAERTDEATERLGVAREKRAYTPHLTLARVEPRTDLTTLRQEAARLQDADWGSFEAKAFYLYLSSPGQAGSVYTKLAEYPLG
jgi:RNA 2',3'-cyclic 3'-phosphodiesterase